MSDFSWNSFKELLDKKEKDLISDNLKLENKLDPKNSSLLYDPSEEEILNRQARDSELLNAAANIGGVKALKLPQVSQIRNLINAEKTAPAIEHSPEAIAAAEKRWGMSPPEPKSKIQLEHEELTKQLEARKHLPIKPTEIEHGSIKDFARITPEEAFSLLSKDEKWASLRRALDKPPK